ncbi:MAG TPA: sigma-70 family RNA polymerase sigma factor [Thermoleophilaceae bacterium]|nr:sigma-70 family RNA polymerase sigma factor [Thermoleophilaceae bacterium]
MTALATDSGRKTPARLAGSAILALQSDQRLVKLVRAGHERAFEAIVERYRQPLVRFCARILPESRCEDAVQQAFINAHGALTASDEAVQLKPWLFAITRNAALNMLRQNGWNYDQIPLDFDGVRRPDQLFEQRIELQETVAALNGLPDRQRDAIVMREFEGRSYDEIALALGANDGAVRQLLNRARVTLRNAASMLVPPPLVVRAAASMPPGDGRRVAEIVGGLGAAGIAKAGATALVAGSLVVGAVEAPLPIGDSHKPTHAKATLSADHRSASAAAHDVTVASPSTPRPATATPAKRVSRNSGRSQAAPSPAHERSGSGDDRREGSRERSGPGGGSDDSTRSTSGSGDDSLTRSGSGDRSGTSGGSGSDDVIATAPAGTDDGGTSGSSGPGSGTSGSDSGSSGSGSGDITTTTPTTTTQTSNSGPGSSGSDDSTKSGSSSGSGSSDLLEH